MNKKNMFQKVASRASQAKIFETVIQLQVVSIYSTKLYGNISNLNPYFSNSVWFSKVFFTFDFQ